jgi:hypothetical protein
MIREQAGCSKRLTMRVTQAAGRWILRTGGVAGAAGAAA